MNVAVGEIGADGPLVVEREEIGGQFMAFDSGVSALEEREGEWGGG